MFRQTLNPDENRRGEKLRTVREISEAYATRAATPTGVTEALIERIEKLNPTLNCFITLLKDSAWPLPKNRRKGSARAGRWGPSTEFLWPSRT